MTYSSGWLAKPSRLLKCSGKILNHIITKRYTSHYEVLKVSRSANAGEIKQAYFTMCKQFHPDVNPSANAVSKFR